MPKRNETSGLRWFILRFSSHTMRVRPFILFAVLLGIGLRCGIGVNPLNYSNTPVDPGDIDVVPSLAGISPISGVRGTLVTIQGTGFNSRTRVTLGASTCLQIQINSSTELTCVAGANGPGAADLTVSNSSGEGGTSPLAFTYRSFLYVGDSVQDDVRGFLLNTDGTTSAVPGSPFQLQDVVDMAADPLGRFLFVLCDINPGLNVLSVNPTDGSLSPVAGSPFETQVSASRTAVAVSEDGKFLYVGLSNSNANSLLSYSIHPDTGFLTSLGGSFTTYEIRDFVVVPDIAAIYASTDLPSTKSLSALAISSNGALSHFEGSPHAHADSQRFLTETSGHVIASTSGKDFLSYAVSPSGALTLRHTLSYPDNFNGGGVFAPHTKPFLYAIPAASGDVHRLSLDTQTGILSVLPKHPLLTPISVLSGDPQGKLLVAGLPQSDLISVLPINSADGSLGTGVTQSVGNTPSTIAIW